ncbi:MAG: cellulase family glycosylhydrolase [Prolixibacteraceae bacterium]|nr:cellulase family glycosylhydrolase [Prolixibacteraceae bacterium]
MNILRFTNTLAFLLISNISLFSASGQTNNTDDKKRIDTFPGDIPEATVPEISAHKNIIVNDGQFTDPAGRTLFLRGINLGGSSKVPCKPNGATHIRDGFFNGKDVSFVGRPFPLEEADEHFSRLKAWGFHFLRFLVTWEAIEHEGPDIYDREYIAFVKALVEKANEYGINLIIDPHEDVWSRFSGGDGAPLWTFEIIGMDVTKFQETGAAIVHNTYGDPFPKMIWYTNNYKLAASTMFTLFFGGNDFAPKTKVEGVPVQDYLQQHYISAMLQLAKEIKGLPNVIGFELMNEPSAGYIGIEDITKPYSSEVIGDAPTPWQGILLGEGIQQEIQRFRIGAVSLKSDGKKILNKGKVTVWKEGKPGIWIQNGLAEKTPDGTYQLNDTAYFSRVNGQEVDFNEMYYKPFARKFAEAITAIDTSWAIVVDNVLSPYPLELPRLKDIEGVKWVNGSHWYDDITLVKKKYLPFLGLYERKVVFGKRKVFSAFAKTLNNMIEETRERFGNAPLFLGEFGIPFDMNSARAYRTGNFSAQTKALDRSIRVAEKNRMSYTLWNYTADNTNERGDQWNGEDLSIFSLSQQTNPNNINSGGRALDAAIRPYPKKINGKLREYAYDYKTKELRIRFKVEELSDYPTEIFLPEYVYGDAFRVYAENGQLAFDKKERILLYYPDRSGEHNVIVKPASF